jgi:Ca-activated chloride channel family protein
VDFTAHVVGFDLKAEELQQISCIAEKTGGLFLPARDAESLRDAIGTAITEVQAAEPVKEPEPEPEPPVREAQLTVPDTVPAGSDFEVGWQVDPEVKGDYITIVPKDAEDGEYANFNYTRKGNPLTLTALIEPREAEVRFISGRGGEVLAREPVTVTEVQASLQVPQQIPAGSPFDVAWEGPDNRGDYVTIVKPDADEGQYGDYERTAKGTPLELLAPIDPGEYEVRYVTGQDAKTLARAPITVTPVQVSLEAPEQVVAGALVPVKYQGPDNPNDYITIVSPDADAGRHGNYNYTRRGNPVKVKAPIEPGDYQIRYVTGQGARTLATADLTVTEAEVALSAPNEAVAGSQVPVEWVGPDNQNDYLTIVPVGAPEGESGNYEYTRRGNPAKVKAPMEPGDYLIRYQAGQGDGTLASIPLTVTEAEVSLSAPEQAVAGSPVPVEWIGPDNQGDYLTVVPVGTPEGEYGNYEYTRRGNPAKVKAPMEPGDYLIRYQAGQGDGTLASVPLQVVEAEISLSAPETAVIGSRVPVTWEGPNNQGDLITIVEPGSLEQRTGNFEYTRKGNPLPVTAPLEPGQYEIRYVSGQGADTLEKITIELTEAQISFTDVPAEVVAGQNVKIFWEGPDNVQDYITIVPKNAPEGESGDLARTRKGSPADVKAPAEPGPAEIRYVSGQKDKTLYRQDLRVIAGE